MTNDTFLNDIKGVIKNEYASIVDDGTCSDVVSYIDTGSYTLNALISGSIYGGIQSNKITTLAGEQATGKTFFAISMMKNFLDTNKKGVVIYFDTEGGVHKKMLQKRGIDIKRVIYNPVSTVEEFGSEAFRIVDHYLKHENKKEHPLFMVLDSFGMLSTTKEVDDVSTDSGKKDMTRAQSAKKVFRTLTIKMGVANIPLVVTNHTYELIGTYYPQKVMGGGKGLYFASTNILFLTKSKFKNADKTEQIGVEIKATGVKLRDTKENTRVSIKLDFQKGLDRYYGLVDIAIKANIFKKLSKQIELPDGTKVFEKKINDNPEKYFTEDILKQLETYVNKNFVYGSYMETENEN